MGQDTYLDVKVDDFDGATTIRIPASWVGNDKESWIVGLSKLRPKGTSRRKWGNRCRLETCLHFGISFKDCNVRMSPAQFPAMPLEERVRFEKTCDPELPKIAKEYKQLAADLLERAVRMEDMLLAMMRVGEASKAYVVAMEDVYGGMKEDLECALELLEECNGSTKAKEIASEIIGLASKI